MVEFCAVGELRLRTGYATMVGDYSRLAAKKQGRQEQQETAWDNRSRCAIPT